VAQSVVLKGISEVLTSNVGTVVVLLNGGSDEGGLEEFEEFC
jgi:hypothetical protein